MNTKLLLLALVGTIFLAGCSASQTARSKAKAREFTEAIETAAERGDSAAFAAMLSALDTEMESMSDEELLTFVSHWEDPPFMIWRNRVTRRLIEAAEKQGSARTQADPSE